MTSPAGAHTVRRHNRTLLLTAIDDGPGRSRAELADAIGLARATVGTQVDELIATGLVIESPGAKGRAPGRPASPLTLNPDGPAALGIEINTGYLAACLVDLTGTMRARRTVPGDRRGDPPAAVLDRACLLAAELAAETGLSAAGAAVALPALVDATGIARRAPNLPAWSGYPVAATLEFTLGLPVVAVSNEANLAALAEHRFAGAPDDFVLVTGEIGVGGGIVTGGRLLTGVHGFAGELGHICVEPDGPPCGCGSRGCLEQFAGAEALLRAAAVDTTDALEQAAAAGEPRADAVLRAAGRALGIALAGVVNILDVPAVILGGTLARLSPWLIGALTAELTRGVASRLDVSVRPSALDGNAALLGAAGTVRDALLTGTLPAASH